MSTMSTIFKIKIRSSLPSFTISQLVMVIKLKLNKYFSIDKVKLKH